MKYMHHCRGCLYSVKLNTGFKLNKLIFVNRRTDCYSVNFINAVLRVHNFVCQLTVICENEHSLRIFVKSADRVNSCAHIFHKLSNAFSASVIAHCSNKSSRFIEHNIAVRRLCIGKHTLTVYKYLICRSYLVAELSGFAVHFYMTVNNHLLCFSS